MNIAKLVVLTIWPCFACILVNSQVPTYKLSGKIMTSENKAAEAATIVLLRAHDSSVIKMNQADSSGTFLFEHITKGDYRLFITFSGFQNHQTAIIPVDSANHSAEMPVIILQPNGKSLKEVDVISKKPFIEQKLDRTIVNVGSMISATGSNALELLEKLPGVIVDQNGNISFKGKPGVMILIDGKQTYLSGDNLANYLKSLQASQLDQVELMPNPPAKYEAAGNAGVINIKTKRTRTKGFNGSIAASVGKSRMWRTNESLAINYRTGKINLFANAGFSIQNSYRKLSLQRNYFDESNNLTSVYKSATYFKPTTYNPNLKTGIDYYISPKKTIGLVFTGSWSSGTVENPGKNILYNGAGVVDSTIVADNNTRNKFNNGGLSLNYTQQYEERGKSLSFDFDYIKYAAISDQTFLNHIFHPGGDLKSAQLITNNLPAIIHIYSGKTDFAQPLTNKGQLEAGLKSSYVSTDNDANYYNIKYNTPIIDFNLSNHFLYRENINAAYLNFRKEIKRISFQSGVRLENTNIRGRQVGNPQHPDSSFTQHYTNLFPTAYFSYKLDTAGAHLLRLSYGKRIDRPYYKDLNPFVTIVDKFTNFSGNPYLKPQQSSNYELGYNYKSILTLSLVYSNTNNYQIETIRQLGAIFISSTTNLASRQYKAINANASFNPTKWWNCNLFAEAVNLKFTSVLFDSYLDTQKTYYYIEANNQFTLPGNWSIQLSGFYISSRIAGQFNLDPKGALNAGIQKRVLKNKCSLKLSASDIIRTSFSSGSISNVKGATSIYHNDFDTRMVSFGLSYNFGNATNVVRKRNVGSSQSEQSRVKN